MYLCTFIYKGKVKVNVIYKYSEYEVGGKKYSLVDCVKLQTFELAGTINR